MVDDLLGWDLMGNVDNISVLKLRLEFHNFLFYRIILLTFKGLIYFDISVQGFLFEDGGRVVLIDCGGGC